METKNYFVRENNTKQQYFCQLQVSNKFRNTMNAAELELCDWLVNSLVHHAATEEQMHKIAIEVQRRVDEVNRKWDGQSLFLVMTYAPLRTMESGYIRIERANRRHQCLLLPIIDFRGFVKNE